MNKGAIFTPEQALQQGGQPSAASACYDAWLAEVKRRCDSYGLPFDAIDGSDWMEFYDDGQLEYDAIKLAFSD